MMLRFPIFLSVIFVVRNQAELLESLLSEASTFVSALARDYELIVIDNASDDDSIQVLQQLTREQGYPNIQVYALTQEVDSTTMAWIGLERALGDWVALIDPLTDDFHFLPDMLLKTMQGADLIFAHNQKQTTQNFGYRSASRIFNRLYQWFNGISLVQEAPFYRMLNKKMIQFILKHPHPTITYRHLPSIQGFKRVHLQYSATPKSPKIKPLKDSIDRAMQLLVSTTRTPMRLVTSLALFGAFSNFLYALYVLAIAALKTEVASGWISLSLQQSGMFFLISVVLLVLGEYILHMTSLSNRHQLQHIGQEFSSARVAGLDTLNVESVDSSTIVT